MTERPTGLRSPPQARREQILNPAESRPALSRFELLEEGESKLLIDTVQFQLDGLFAKTSTTALRRKSAWKLLEICLSSPQTLSTFRSNGVAKTLLRVTGLVSSEQDEDVRCTLQALALVLVRDHDGQIMPGVDLPVNVFLALLDCVANRKSQSVSKSSSPMRLGTQEKKSELVAATGPVNALQRKRKFGKQQLMTQPIVMPIVASLREGVCGERLGRGRGQRWAEPQEAADGETDESSSAARLARLWPLLTALMPPTHLGLAVASRYLTSLVQQSVSAEQEPQTGVDVGQRRTALKEYQRLLRFPTQELEPDQHKGPSASCVLPHMTPLQQLVHLIELQSVAAITYVKAAAELTKATLVSETDSQAESGAGAQLLLSLCVLDSACFRCPENQRYLAEHSSACHTLLALLRSLSPIMAAELLALHDHEAEASTVASPFLKLSKNPHGKPTVKATTSSLASLNEDGAISSPSSSCQLPGSAPPYSTPCPPVAASLVNQQTESRMLAQLFSELQAAPTVAAGTALGSDLRISACDLWLAGLRTLVSLSHCCTSSCVALKAKGAAEVAIGSLVLALSWREFVVGRASLPLGPAKVVISAHNADGPHKIRHKCNASLSPEETGLDRIVFDACLFLMTFLSNLAEGQGNSLLAGTAHPSSSSSPPLVAIAADYSKSSSTPAVLQAMIPAMSVVDCVDSLGLRSLLPPAPMILAISLGLNTNNPSVHISPVFDLACRALLSESSIMMADLVDTDASMVIASAADIQAASELLPTSESNHGVPFNDAGKVDWEIVTKKSSTCNQADCSHRVRFDAVAAGSGSEARLPVGEIILAAHASLLLNALSSSAAGSQNTDATDSHLSRRPQVPGSRCGSQLVRHLLDKLPRKSWWLPIRVLKAFLSLQGHSGVLLLESVQPVVAAVQSMEREDAEATEAASVVGAATTTESDATDATIRQQRSQFYAQPTVQSRRSKMVPTESQQPQGNESENPDRNDQSTLPNWVLNSPTSQSQYKIPRSDCPGEVKRRDVLTGHWDEASWGDFVWDAAKQKHRAGAGVGTAVDEVFIDSTPGKALTSAKARSSDTNLRISPLVTPVPQFQSRSASGATKANAKSKKFPGSDDSPSIALSKIDASPFVSYTKLDEARLLELMWGAKSQGHGALVGPKKKAIEAASRTFGKKTIKLQTKSDGSTVSSLAANSSPTRGKCSQSIHAPNCQDRAQVQGKITPSSGMRRKPYASVASSGGRKRPFSEVLSNSAPGKAKRSALDESWAE